MTSNEISRCLERNINLVLDSIGQIKLLSQVVSGEVAIGIRLNVGTAINGNEIKADPEYRFGLIPAELPKALEIICHHNIRIIGAHSYFGTGIMRPEILLEGLVRLGDFAQCLPDLRYIDVGGGFGVPNCLEDDEFDINAYAKGAEQALSRIKTRWGNDLDLYIEPGRYLAADCGYFFVKVVDIKYREDRIFVGTNASVANFPRPLLYPETAIHPCMIAGERSGAPPHEKPIYICGNSTYSRDFLARAVTLPLPHLGDTLIFYNAGAYSRSMISDFLGKDRPQEAFAGL
jgi:diaminopimelate decarboxylase